MASNRPRMIAPRLASGDRRENFGHGLPPSIKEGLRKIARRENKSMSWVMEEVIIRYFHLRTPEYVERKADVEKAVEPIKQTTRSNRAPAIREAASAYQ
jgi:hypothetical protein